MEILLLSILEVSSIAATAFCFKGKWFSKLYVASICWLWAMYSLTAGNYFFLSIAIVMFAADVRFFSKP